MDWQSAVMSRISTLEQRLSGSRNDRASFTTICSSPGTQLPVGPSAGLNDDSACFSNEEESDSDYAAPKFHSGTDLLTPISILDRTVSRGVGDLVPSSTTESHTRRRSTDCTGFLMCSKADTQMWNERSRTQDIESLRATFKIYFDTLNSHCKCTPRGSKPTYDDRSLPERVLLSCAIRKLPLR